MDMVGHHHPGMYIHPELCGIILEPTCISTVILIGNKAGLPVVPTLDDMNRHASRRYS
jgi:hypothetical protein